MRRVSDTYLPPAIILNRNAQGRRDIFALLKRAAIRPEIWLNRALRFEIRISLNLLDLIFMPDTALNRAYIVAFASYISVLRLLYV